MEGGDKKFTEGVGEDQLAVMFKSLDAAVEFSEVRLFRLRSQLKLRSRFVADSFAGFLGEEVRRAHRSI